MLVLLLGQSKDTEILMILWATRFTAMTSKSWLTSGIIQDSAIQAFERSIRNSLIVKINRVCQEVVVQRKGEVVKLDTVSEMKHQRAT